MSCVQSNRKSDFICMKFSTQLTRYLQSFIKFAQKVCFAFRKKDQKNTLSTCQKKTTTIYVFIFNKFNFHNCFLTFLTLKQFTVRTNWLLVYQQILSEKSIVLSNIAQLTLICNFQVKYFISNLPVFNTILITVIGLSGVQFGHNHTSD